jgi:beta-glucanase (GH16 family)
VYTTVHWGTNYNAANHQSDGKAFTGPDFTANFHTFAVDWDASHVIWYVDAVEVHRHEGVGVPQVNMYVIANLAVGGNWPKAPDATTVFPGNYDIDYIRAYQRDPDAGAGSDASAGSDANPGSDASVASDAAPADVAAQDQAALTPDDAGNQVDATGAKPEPVTAASKGCSCSSVRSERRISPLALLLAVAACRRRRR